MYLRNRLTKEGVQIMGLGHYKSPKERIYDSIDYGNSEIIQSLLRHYHEFKLEREGEMSTELMIVCLDIEEAIKGANITPRQKEAVTHYMTGMTEEDIGVKMGGISHQAVHKLVMKVANKLSDYLTRGENK